MRAALACALLLVLLLPACSGSGDPSPAPTSTPHPGTAPPSTPPPTPTGNPEDQAAQAAIAAVKKLYADFNDALISGDSAVYREDFAKSCIYCAANAELIDATTEKNRKIVGGAYKLTDVQLGTVAGQLVVVQGMVSQREAKLMKGGVVLRVYRAAPPDLSTWDVRSSRRQVDRHQRGDPQVRRLLAVGFTTLLALVAVVVVNASSAEACTTVGLSSDSQASSCGKLDWSYDPHRRQFDSKTKMTAPDDPEGSKYVYRLVAACSSNVTQPTGSQLCLNAFACPPIDGPDGQPVQGAKYQGMRAPRGPNGELKGVMQPYGKPVCVYRGRSVPMAAVVAAVRDQLVKEVGRPQVTVQPATRGLIRFPMLFSAPAQRVTSLAITRPLAGAIVATPTYRWELGEGQSATGAGHRYLQAVDPSEPSSDGYYVKATYQRVGAHRVRLRLTWQATVHLGPAVGGLDVDLDPIVFTAAGTATTVSATNRLYADLPH